MRHPYYDAGRCSLEAAAALLLVVRNSMLLDGGCDERLVRRLDDCRTEILTVMKSYRPQKKC